MKSLPGWISKTGMAILIAALSISAMWLFVAILVGVLNADFHNRSPQSITLRTEREHHVKVKIIVHKLLVEENAVEVSLLVQGDYAKLPKALQDRDPCYVLVYQDASDQDAPPKTFNVACKTAHIPGMADDRFSAETPPFKLTAYPSVEAYPFDDWEFFPMMTLITQAPVFSGAVFSIERMIPGKELSVSGDAYNWHIHLQRPAAEKVLVLTVGIAFLLLSLLISWRLFSGHIVLSGIQELLTLAGFVVAIAGLRDMLGVSRVAGVSLWEMAVIGVPMTALCLGMAYSTLRRMAKPPAVTPGDGSEAKQAARDQDSAS
ncbi:hypothetical protein AWB76_01740 [Caballeronia temeraria]|uniref:Uncharacterized protein n=1 Tax=Caballeronia temeraria TaxID=1777137 RepID=A0A158A4I0_9BURK|nr:hypothetical protein [Caballeronia temeraria]SAK52645.1 hypothetical protein AWB76_01740 [Caballeronia temeraria]